MSAPAVDHLTLTVTDLDVSQRFYCSLLGLVRLADFGSVRVLVHPPTGFTLSLARHDTGGGRFDEARTGLDHLGLAAASREELVAREQQLAAMGATYTPVRDTPLASHLNLRDPDGIALEFIASGPALAAGYAELRDTTLTPEGIEARARELMVEAGALSS
jgi:catechol 2,3-dioxygenase-like lactoylglutathione lyase family enzyme